ncbi:putative permease [Lachnellula suecica]|uniref:Putative permease n=1 Tax=Lachnellula suecica TaxID=602035 RepID=A0A8T9C9F4_9HELO|nr:putative permease [Lachnellula suecica]
MGNAFRQRLTSIKEGAKEKTKPAGWIMPRQKSSFGDEDSWTNIDCDVTPIERRTWTGWTMGGYWFSDALNAQSWEAPASIIAVGLTWRESVYCIIFGSLVCTVPLVLNGSIGAKLHVPFPVALRSSFGWYFSRFAIVVRMVTALFWHAIQTYTGSTAMTQMIRAIWPSFLDIPNHIPEVVGITTQQMVSHFIFFSVQFPILLTPPHKLQAFFIFKAVVVTITCVGVVIAMTKKAGGTGQIWNQEYTVHGSMRSWLILSSLSSITGGWATMATNIPDFTRYLKNHRAIYYQVAFLPLIQLGLGLFGIISCSAAKVVYGEYIWDPLTLASHWEGPSGRAGAFFVGFAWVVAQIGTNLSANVISFANDLTSLFPKYINIRRGVIVGTITASWIMVPWKIIHSAASLLSFMSGLGIFLAPIAAILAADFWIVKHRHIDIPGLYSRHGRYRYNAAGTNWRALVAFLISVVPNLPGMAAQVNPKLKVGGAQYIYDMFYLYGFTSAFVVYSLLSHFFPAPDTIISATINEEVEVIGGVEYRNDGLSTPVEAGTGSDAGDEKAVVKSTEYNV